MVERGEVHWRALAHAGRIGNEWSDSFGRMPHACSERRGLPGRIREGRHFFRVRVKVEDIAGGSMLHHARVVHFMERARTDLARMVGVDQKAMFESAEGSYVVASIGMSLRAPAKLFDELVVETEVLKNRIPSSAPLQRLRRGRDLIAEATIVIAFVDSEGRAAAQPQAWRQRFDDAIGASVVPRRWPGRSDDDGHPSHAGPL